MSDMLKTFVDQELNQRIQKEYPHLKYPAAVYAKITNVKKEVAYYSYIIRILDKNKKENSKFPEIPKVKSESLYESGDVVVAIFLYGDVMPYIVGRAV